MTATRSPCGHTCKSQSELPIASGKSRARTLQIRRSATLGRCRHAALPLEASDPSIRGLLASGRWQASGACRGRFQL